MTRSIKTGRLTPPTPAAPRIRLDPARRSGPGDEFEQQIAARIIGQEDAVQLISRLYQTFLAGMHPPNRPLGVALFLGPTGSGKTRLVEAAAEVILGDAKAFLKIDCAEYQQPHEMAKLIGSPPGYVGHRETAALLSQENLDRFQTPEHPLSLVLFDEIEKACDTLWHLLLGVLDRGRLSLGDNRSVDFSRTLIVLTSNLGAREMADTMAGGLGFGAGRGSRARDSVERGISRVAIRAARKKFSPEFMNRIDQTVVFRPLSEEQLRQIVGLELQAVQDRIFQAPSKAFVLEYGDGAKELLLREGTDPQYGARHLKRAVERFLVSPLSALMASGQIGAGDVVNVDLDLQTNQLVFEKDEADTSGTAASPDPLSTAIPSIASRMPLEARGQYQPAAGSRTPMQQLAETMQQAGLL